MRFFASLAAVIFLAAAALVGCSNTQKAARNGNAGAVNAPPVTRTNPDNVRRVTIAELRDALDKGTAVVVDVRTEMQYNQEHIKDALLMPENQVSTRAQELPKDKLIVLYCS